MKTGRNQPCPCGSGKKYKRCCLGRDEERARAAAAPPSEDASAAAQASSEAPEAEPLENPSGPPGTGTRDEPADGMAGLFALWEESDYEGKFAIFGRNLRTPGAMDGEMAFELLSDLYYETCARDERDRFDAAVADLRRRLPDVYEQEADHIIDWQIDNAIIGSRPYDLGDLLRELASLAGENVDLLRRTMDQLAFHGQQDLLADLVKNAWAGFARSGLQPEDLEDLPDRARAVTILDHLERTGRAKESDRVLAVRLELFDDSEPADLPGYVALVAGAAPAGYALGDFQGGEWRESLADLAVEFIGHARRKEGVPYCKSELASRVLVTYLVGRAGEGEAERRRGAGKKRGGKRRLAPPHEHPLLPDAATLDRFLAEYFQIPFTFEPYRAAILLESLPVWSRFLESRGLLDAAVSRRTLDALRGPVTAVRAILERETSDPLLGRVLADWPRPSPAGAAPSRDGAPMAPPTASKRKTTGEGIDWKRAVPRGVPADDFLEGKDMNDPGDLEEAVRDFVHHMGKGYFLQWEAVIREEQGLPLSSRQKDAIDELANFNDDDGEEAAILYIDGLERPTEPWFETARKIARGLLLDGGFRTDGALYEVVTQGWPDLTAAIAGHAAGLSLPEGIEGAIDVIPSELQHRLWIQASFATLGGIGQRTQGRGMISLRDPEEEWRIDAFLTSLRKHRASVDQLHLTLAKLRSLLVMPDGEAEIFAQMASQKLGLASGDHPIADRLSTAGTFEGDAIGT